MMHNNFNPFGDIPEMPTPQPDNLTDEERKAIEKLKGSANMTPSESEKRNIFSRLRHLFT